MFKVNIEVSLELTAPILSQSTTIGAYGVDSPMAVNADGFYCLPGTLVKGKLRESWKELQDIMEDAFSLNIDELLGKKSNEDEKPESFDPHRGSLYFSDFISFKQKSNKNYLYRIAIESERGSVKDGSYLVMDAPFKPGERFDFKGTITFFAETEEKAREIQRQLETGLKWLTSLGSERTIGFGGLEQVKFNVNIIPLKTAIQQKPLENNFLYIKIKPLAPFCLAKRRVAKNLFESEEIISGGVIKGAIADTWNKILGERGNKKIDKNTDSTRQELGEHFDKLRITHAFPALPDSPRPVKQPLSLIKVKGNGNDILRDVALIKKPGLIKKQAPAFAIDWKDYSDVTSEFGWPKLKKELRVRTAINEDTGRAKDEQLFAYETIVPEKHIWYAKIDFSAIPRNDDVRSKVAFQLQSLLSYGIYGLGKTKVPVEVELIKPFQDKHSSKFVPVRGNWVITLQTSAIICNPELLRNDSLLNVYKKAFSSMPDMPEKLSLSYFYAQQSLAGGQYLQKRFKNKQMYQPYLLTDPGSVFVFESHKENEVQEREIMEEWFLHGLPLPDWAKDRYGDRWSCCPYIRENGYGEIAVNLDVHSGYKPEEGTEYEAI